MRYFQQPLLFVDDWPSYLPVIYGLLGLWFDLERVSVITGACRNGTCEELKGRKDLGRRVPRLWGFWLQNLR